MQRYDDLLCESFQVLIVAKDLFQHNLFYLSFDGMVLSEVLGERKDSLIFRKRSNNDTPFK